MAKEPKAPWVEVWESPRTTVIPGDVTARDAVAVARRVHEVGVRVYALQQARAEAFLEAGDGARHGRHRHAEGPRRAGERGALEAGALPGLLPGGRPLDDEDARTAVSEIWGTDLAPRPGRDTAGIIDAAKAVAAVTGGDAVDPEPSPEPSAPATTEPTEEPADPATDEPTPTPSPTTDPDNPTGGHGIGQYYYCQIFGCD